MDFLEIAELGSSGATVVLLFWIIIKQIPEKDKDFTRSLNRFTMAINRLTMVLLSNLDLPTSEKLKLHDEITNQIYENGNGNGK
jgi:P pilus assembly chaperone PapD